MTTVATDGVTMACDGLSTFHGAIIRRNSNKISRLKDGSLFAAAGDSQEGQAVEAWLNNGAVKEEWPPVDDVDVMVLRPDGTVITYDKWSKGFGDEVELPFAIGSGYQYAIAAMDLGASPERAVQAAMKRDPNTGGTLRVVALKED